MPSYKSSEPKEFVRIEPGIYALRIADAVEKTSQNGNPMINLEMNIILPSGDSGPRVYSRLVFTPKAAPIIDGFRASLGEKVIDGEDVEIITDELIGKEAVAMLEYEPGLKDPEKEYLNVKYWVHRKKRESFLSGGKVKATPSPASPQAPTAEDDDIPF